MKKKIIIPILAACWCLLLVASCESDLPRFAHYSAYDFSKLDENGGNWTPVLLASPNQITITAPEDVNSAAYLAELAEVKTAMSNLTDGQRGAVDYWTNNPIIRWNEIALELAAKYNLIPDQIRTTPIHFQILLLQKALHLSLLLTRLIPVECLHT